MSVKFEFDCDVPGCNRHIEIEMVKSPTGDLRRAREETEAAFNRQIRSHLLTHVRVGYQPVAIPPGRRVMGPDEET